MTTFTDYEKFAIREMAKHAVAPSPMQAALEMTGKPAAKLLEAAHSSNNKIVKKAVASIDAAIHKSLRATIAMGKKLTSDDAIRKEFLKQHNVVIDHLEEIRTRSLKEMDIVADTFRASNGFFVTTGGAAMGLATTASAGLLLPLVVSSDVTASMTLMSRHIGQVAASYGYSPRDPMNIPHILSAMVPLSSSSDEGFLAAKASAFVELNAARKFMNGFTGDLTADAVQKSCPMLIKLLQKVAERLGVVITEKELGLLIPGIAVVLNGALNLAFQQMNHTSAKDYFRLLYLQEKYGEHLVYDALEKEKQILRSKTA